MTATRDKRRTVFALVVLGCLLVAGGSVALSAFGGAVPGAPGG